MFIHYTMHPPRSKLVHILVTIILLECVIVFTLTMMSLMTSSHWLYLERTADSIRDTFSSCPWERKNATLNVSLPVSIHGNVSIRDDMFAKCFEINKSREGIYRLMDARNFREIVCNKTDRRFLERWEYSGYTALASYPGSGNTWVRHLIEELTGIHTGSLYMDPGLKKVFKAERYTERVIVIKTHEILTKPKTLKYSRAILLVRDPYESLLSHYNLGLTLSHTSYPGREHFLNNSFTHFVEHNLPKWSDFYLEWIRNFDGQLFVLWYENLNTDILNTLSKMAAFFKTEVTLRKLWCIESRKEGLFRRGRKPEWMKPSIILSEHVYQNLTKAKQQLVYEIKKRGLSVNHTINHIVNHIVNENVNYSES